MTIEDVEGDLLDQEVDAIVNAWNRNVIPWWLLIPQGVSGTIERVAIEDAAALVKVSGIGPKRAATIRALFSEPDDVSSWATGPLLETKSTAQLPIPPGRG
jgi:hypothetical protein